MLLKHPSGYAFSYVSASSTDSWQHGHSLLDPANPLSATLETAGLVVGASSSAGSQHGDDSSSAGFVFNDADPAGQEHWGAAHSKVRG